MSASATAISEFVEALVGHIGASVIGKSPTLVTVADAISSMPEPAQWAVVATGAGVAGALKDPIKRAVVRLGPLGAIIEPFLTEILEGLLVGGTKSFAHFDDFKSQVVTGLKKKIPTGKTDAPLMSDEYTLEVSLGMLHATEVCFDLLQRANIFEAVNGELATVDLSDPRKPRKIVIRPALTYRTKKVASKDVACQIGIHTCPRCASSLAAGGMLVTGVPSKATEPPKGKSFKESLTANELSALMALRDLVAAVGPREKALFDTAEKDNWSKVALEMKKVLLPQFMAVHADGELVNVLVRRFVNTLDAAYDPDPRDIAEYATADAIAAGMRNAGGLRGATRGLLGHVGHAGRAAWDLSKGPILFVSLVYITLFVIGASLWYKGLVADDSGTIVTGMAILAIWWISLIPAQKALDWAMDQWRIIGKRVGFDVSPETDSIEWLAKTARDAGVWVLFFGGVTLVMTMLGWPLKIRWIVLASGIMPIARALHMSMRPDLKAERAKKIDLTNNTVLGLAGVAIILIGVVDTCFGWFDWLKGSDATGDSVVSFSLSFGSWPWYGWLVVAVVCLAAAGFISTYLEPKRDDPDNNRSLRTTLVLVAVLAALGCGLTGIITGVVYYRHGGSPSHVVVAEAAAAELPQAVNVNVTISETPTSAPAAAPAPVPPPASTKAPKASTHPAPSKVATAAPPKAHASGSRRFSDTKCRELTTTPEGFASCQRKRWP